MEIQSEIKAPKGQYNSFGNYNYRSCEDILEAVKPLLKNKGLVLNIYDLIESIGQRYYVKATAVILDIENGEKVEATAFAREEETKKGMDAAQITGSASSYARKYALNGLFCIDDVKDSDTQDNTKQDKPDKKPLYLQDVDKKTTTETLKCADCSKSITEGIRKFSITKFGRALCPECQKK